MRASLWAGAAALGLGACMGQADPPQGTGTNVQAATAAVHGGVQQLSSGVAKAASLLGGWSLVQNGTLSLCQTKTAVGADGNPVDQQTCTPLDVYLKDLAAEITTWATDHLFNVAHLSPDSTLTNLVFCLKAADACPQADPNNPGDSVPARCANLLTQVPVCVAVSAGTAGQYDGTLRIGNSPTYSPAVLHITSNNLGAEVALAELKPAVEAMAAAYGVSLSDLFPTGLAGKLGFELVNPSADAFTARFSVLEDASVDLFSPADDRRSELRIASGTTIVASVDKAQQQVDLQIDHKAVDLKIAADLLFGRTACRFLSQSCPDRRQLSGAFSSHLPGLSGTGSLRIEPSLETLKVTNMSLGDEPLRVYFGGSSAPAEIGAVDLNASLSARRVDFTLVRDTTGMTLSASPRLDVVVSHDLRALADMGYALARWALKGTSELRLAGENPAMLFRGAADGRTWIGVKSGSLNLRASGMLEGVSDVDLNLEAGQCLVRASSPVTVDDHPFTLVAAGVCGP